MQISRFNFQNNVLELEDDIDFSSAKLDQNHLRKIENTHVKVIAREYNDLITMDVYVECDITGVCSYTLEDVPLHLKFKDSLEFSNEIEDDEDIFFEPKPIFDLDPYILGLIIASTPTKIVKNGAKLPSSGVGYRVLSEEDYQKEKAEKKDPRWAKLDDIKL